MSEYQGGFRARLARSRSPPISTAADVGGIAGPVAGGVFLPSDRDVDVDAERAGKNGRGELGGELKQGGGARFGTPDSQAA